MRKFAHGRGGNVGGGGDLSEHDCGSEIRAKS